MISRDSSVRLEVAVSLVAFVKATIDEPELFVELLQFVEHEDLHGIQFRGEEAGFYLQL